MKMQPSSIKRWNPLLGEWVILAPVTDNRPWSGMVVPVTEKELPPHDPNCYLCPGIIRAGGAKNPLYKDIHVFNNDFSSLSPATGHSKAQPGTQDQVASGICRVVCFSPQHNISLAKMEAPEIEGVLYAFRDQFLELSSLPYIAYVMIFENKGKVIGVSNPHPHGQIYATDFVPRIPQLMYTNAREYMHKKGQCLFCRLMKKELEDEARIVCQNRYFVAFVPRFARYKYEVTIIPKRHTPSLAGLEPEEIGSLARIYAEMIIRYDNLFQRPFPNITLFYNSPCSQNQDVSPWHFHISFFPPLRNADKLKYMAGFETGGGTIINPSRPSISARELREVSAIHYSKLNAGLNSDPKRKDTKSP